MEAMVGKVTEDLAIKKFEKSEPLLQDALVSKSARINELDLKVRQ